MEGVEEKGGRALDVCDPRAAGSEKVERAPEGLLGVRESGGWQDVRPRANFPAFH